METHEEHLERINRSFQIIEKCDRIIGEINNHLNNKKNVSNDTDNVLLCNVFDNSCQS